MLQNKRMIFKNPGNTGRFARKSNLKKTGCLFLLAVAWLLLACKDEVYNVPEMEDAFYTVHNMTAVYSAADRDSEVVMQLPYGTAVAFESREGEFWKLRSDLHSAGYIAEVDVTENKPDEEGLDAGPTWISISFSGPCFTGAFGKTSILQLSGNRVHSVIEVGHEGNVDRFERNGIYEFNETDLLIKLNPGTLQKLSELGEESEVQDAPRHTMELKYIAQISAFMNTDKAHYSEAPDFIHHEEECAFIKDECQVGQPEDGYFERIGYYCNERIIYGEDHIPGSGSESFDRGNGAGPEYFYDG